MGIFIALMMICLLSGCATPKATVKNKVALPSQETNGKKEQSAQEYLFKAKDIEAIQLTGQEILDGKEADMSVKISDTINMDFHISRDNPNGTKLYAIYNSTAYNLAVNYICPDVFENDEAIPAYTYQIACHDFNGDGIKELIIACGNKNDKLSLFIFEVVIDSEFIFHSTNYILGYKDAYTNDKNEICVPYTNGHKTYRYNIKAQDAEYAKLSGTIKVSADYLTQEKLEKYKNAVKYVLNNDAPSILLMPTQTLENVIIFSIEYDANTEKYCTRDVLYSIPRITHDTPLIVEAFMQDFPTLGISYTDETGMKQSCGIAESLKDGTLFLFEMEIAKG